MVVIKRPIQKDLHEMREEVISNSGHVSEDVRKIKKGKKVRFDFLIEEDVLREIENSLDGGLTTKTSFILQAIHEKLRGK